MSAPLATPLRTHAALIAVQIMFGTMGVVSKVVLRQLPPEALVGLRALSAALVLTTIALATKKLRVPSRADALTFVLAAATGVIGNQLLYMAGLNRSTATNGVVLGATIPVFTMALAIVTRREEPRGDRVVGLLLAFVGALFVAGADAFDTNTSYLFGNVLIVANCLLYSIYLLVTQRLVQQYSAATVVAWCFLLGGTTLFAIGFPSLSANLPYLTTQTWLCIGYIIVFPTVGTYGLTTFALRSAPSSLVAAYVNLQTIFGAGLAWYFLDERPRTGTIVGAIAILVGLLLVAGLLKRRAR